MTKLIKDRKVRPDGRVSINISFTTQEYDLINHVDYNSENFSQYLKDLIRADMANQVSPGTLKRLEQLIQAGNIEVTFKTK